MKQYKKHVKDWLLNIENVAYFLDKNVFETD